MTTPDVDDRKYHHGNLKTALIEAGLDLLEERGLADLSLRAIAARVGVSHTAPKNHFGTLKGLLTAIAAEGFRRHRVEMERGTTEATDNAGRFRAALEGYVRFAQANPQLFTMMFSPAHVDFEDPELRAASRDSYSVLVQVAGPVAWTPLSGAGPEPKQTELMMWSFVHGFSILSMTGQVDAGGTPGAHLSVADVMPRLGPEG